MTSINENNIINHPNFDRQVELEEHMRGMGIERFRNNLEKNKEGKTESKTKAVGRLVSHAHDKMVEAVENFVKEATSGKAGRRHVAVKYIQMIDDVELISHMTIRSLLDGVSSAVSLTNAAFAISSLLEDEVNSRRFKEAMPRAYKKFHQKAKEESIDRRRRSHLLKPAELLGLEMEDWAHRDKILFGIKLIELFIEATGLMTLTKSQGEKGNSQYIVEANASTIDWIAEENKRLEWMFPVYMPTIIPPKPWTGIRGGGYWTRSIRTLALVKTFNHEYLEELTGREMPEVYGAVNALQETAWQINTRVLDVMTHFWETGSTLGDLPSAADLPLPQKPIWMMGEKPVPKEEQTPEMVEELRKWKAEASNVHSHNGRMKGRRLHLLRMLWVANKFKDEEEIYFPHQIDWRGRAYPVPLYLHPQGNDLQRGLLTFANVVPISTNEDAEWLAIHGAGLWGVDKVSLSERVQWVEDNTAKIIACANDPYENRFWLDADKPWSALAFCFEWAGFKAEGFGFMSSLPIQMDGTCNGLQNFSAMLLDEVGGAAVNLVPGDKPSDIYAKVAEVVNRRIEADLFNETRPTKTVKLADGTTKEVEGMRICDIAKAWHGHVTRKVTKRPVMTLAYGARQYGFVQQVEEDTVKPWRQEDPASYPFTYLNPESNEIVDFGGEACLYIGKLIWESVGEVVIAARAAMDWLQSAARVAAKEGLPVHWTTPTGFLVQQAYRVPNVKTLETTFDKVRLQLNYQAGMGKIDSRRQASGISPNWVHSLDASHLMKTINRAHMEGIRSFSMIHDSYGTHAGNAWALARFLREEFVHMYAQVDVLTVFKENLEHQVSDPSAIPDLPAKGNLDLNLVLESEFFFA